MRNRATKSLIGLGVAFAGVALAFVYPPAAVAVTFIAVVVSLPMHFNVPATRLATYVAVLCNAASIYIGSGSLALAVVPLPLVFWLPPSEFTVRRPRLQVWSPAISLGTSLILLLLAWPTGVWGFALAPWVLALLPAMRWASWPKSVHAFDERPKPLKVGQPMPPLQLPSRENGEIFDLSAQTGRFTLLCFVRGDWCPICHVMMRVFRKEASVLASFNVNLVAISPSQGEEAQSFAKDMGLPYSFLVDEHAAVAKQWGILDLGEHDGDPMPMPVCMLVDPTGILRFMSRPEDFSVFTDKSKVLALVEAHAAKAA